MGEKGQERLKKVAKGCTLVVLFLLIYKFVLRGDTSSDGMWAIFALSIFGNLLSYRIYKKK